jgi:hypothetical protein
VRHRRFAALAVTFLVVATPAFGAEPAPLVRPGEVLRGDFVQERILAGFAAPLRSEGHFVLAPGRGLIWRAIKPFPIVTVITPAGLLQRNEERVLMRLSAARIPALGQVYDLLGRALLGDWRAFEQRYHIERSESGGEWRIELRPRDEVAGTIPFSVMVVSGARFAQTVEIHKQQGDSDRLRFTNQMLSPEPLSADETALLDSVEK